MNNLYIKEQAKIASLLKNSKNIIITCHKNPDKDAIGAILGMENYINRIFPDKIVKCVIEETNSDYWSWWEDTKKINWAGDITEYMEEMDLYILLDASSYKDYKNANKAISLISKCTKICIDHHNDTNASDFDLRINIPAPSAVSTCQLLAEILYQGKDIDKDTARILLIGIYDDLGGMRFLPKGGSSVLDTIKILFDAADIPQLDTLINKSTKISKEMFDVLKKYIENTKIVSTAKIPPFTITYLSLDNYKDYDSYKVNRIRQYYIQEFTCKVSDTDWGVVITEKKDRLKVGFKSLPGSVNVSKLANDYFNGGGHIRRAAGYYIKKDSNLEESVKNITNILINADLELS